MGNAHPFVTSSGHRSFLPSDRGHPPARRSPILVSGAPIGVVADDLTGAADTAAALARPGEHVPVSLTAHPRDFAGRAAFAVTTDCRPCGPADAYRATKVALEAVQDAGAALLYVKVDSNARGSIGAYLAADRDVAKRPVVLAPAFPSRGRTTVQGEVLVNGVPVAQTEMSRDPEAPVRESKLLDLLRSQWPGLPVHSLPLSAVRSGRPSVKAHSRGVVVCDAESDADLDAIAQMILAMSPPPVVAGSAGLAAAIGRELFGAPSRRSWPGPGRGPVFAVLATSSDALTAQVRRAAETAGLSPVALACQHLSRMEEKLPALREAIDRAAAELAAGRNALVYAVGPLPDVDDPVGLVVEHLAHLAFVVARMRAPRGLLVGGGATAHGVLGALGAEAVAVDDEPLPGVAAGRIVGGVLAGRPVVLKPGAAGDDSAVMTLLDYLHLRAAALEAEE